MEIVEKIILSMIVIGILLLIRIYISYLLIVLSENKMKNLLCKVFGHKWKYFYTGGFVKNRIDIRICLRCNKVQQHIESVGFDKGDIWVDLNEENKKYWGKK